jgi:hypothetical protein
MNDEKISLELSVDEVNIILKALGTMPFNQVYELIGSIHQQANQQLFETNSSQNSKDLQIRKD